MGSPEGSDDEKFPYEQLAKGAPRALCPRCAKSRLFSTTGSHGSQGSEFCAPDAVLNGSLGPKWGPSGGARPADGDSCETQRVHEEPEMKKERATEARSAQDGGAVGCCPKAVVGAVASQKWVAKRCVWVEVTNVGV